jgi:hypothetical protein
MSRKTSMHIKIRNDLLAHLRKVSGQTGKSMTRIIEDSLDDAFMGVSDQLTDAQRKLEAAGMQ